MATARDRQQWDHTATILAMLVNVNRGKKGKPAKPQDFHPYRRRRQAPREKVGIEILKAVFVKEKPK